MNNFINNSKNSLQFLNLTNRNQDLNLNLYSKKFFFNNNTSNIHSQNNFNKTSYNTKNFHLNNINIQSYKKIPRNKTNKFRRSKSAINNYNSYSSNIDTRRLS